MLVGLSLVPHWKFLKHNILVSFIIYWRIERTQANPWKAQWKCGIAAVCPDFELFGPHRPRIIPSVEKRKGGGAKVHGAQCMLGGVSLTPSVLPSAAWPLTAQPFPLRGAEAAWRLVATVPGGRMLRTEDSGSSPATCIRGSLLASARPRRPSRTPWGRKRCQKGGGFADGRLRLAALWCDATAPLYQVAARLADVDSWSACFAFLICKCHSAINLFKIWSDTPERFYRDGKVSLTARNQAAAKTICPFISCMGAATLAFPRYDERKVRFEWILSDDWSR